MTPEKKEKSVDFSKSLNECLLQDENGFCEKVEENAADVQDHNEWGQLTGTSGRDSGRDTGRTKNSGDSGADSPDGPVSDSSYNATIDKQWIELVDNSPDSGIASDSAKSRNAGQATEKRHRTHKMQGPYNLFMTTISPMAQINLRKCDVQASSVNSIICNARPVTNTKKLVVGNEVSIVGTGSIQGMGNP